MTETPGDPNSATTTTAPEAMGPIAQQTGAETGAAGTVGAAAATKVELFSPEDFQRTERVHNLFVVGDPNRAPSEKHVRRLIPRPKDNHILDYHNNPNSELVEVWVHEANADMPPPVSDAEQLAHDIEISKVQGILPPGESRTMLELIAKYAAGEPRARQELEAALMQMKSSSELYARALGYDFEIAMREQNLSDMKDKISALESAIAKQSDGAQKTEMIRQMNGLKLKVEPLKSSIQKQQAIRAQQCRGRFIRKETRMDGSVADIHEDPPGNMVLAAATELFSKDGSFPSPEEEGISDEERSRRTTAIAERNAYPLKFARSEFKSMIDAKKHGNSEPMDAFLNKFQEHERPQVKKMLESEALTIFSMKFWLSLLGVLGMESVKYVWKNRTKLGLKTE